MGGARLGAVPPREVQAFRQTGSKAVHVSPDADHYLLALSDGRGPGQDASRLRLRIDEAAPAVPAPERDAEAMGRRRVAMQELLGLGVVGHGPQLRQIDPGPTTTVESTPHRPWLDPPRGTWAPHGPHIDPRPEISHSPISDRPHVDPRLTPGPRSDPLSTPRRPQAGPIVPGSTQDRPLDRPRIDPE